MKKIICVIIFIIKLVFVNNIKAEEITFTKHKESITFDLIYNCTPFSNVIQLSIKCYSPPMDIYSNPKAIKVYFWLNRNGVKREYIYVECKNNSLYKDYSQGNFILTQEDYENIVYNLQSVSIGNKWSIVNKKKVQFLRTYFINHKKENDAIYTENLNRQISTLLNENSKLKADNILLENANQNLSNTINNLNNNINVLNDSINVLNIKLKITTTKLVNAKSNNASYNKKAKAKDITPTDITYENKITFETTSTYTGLVRITKPLSYENSSNKIKTLPNNSVITIIKMGVKYTTFIVNTNTSTPIKGKVKTTELMNSCVNVIKTEQIVARNLQ